MPHVLVKTDMTEIPAGCHACEFGDSYGAVGDRYCRIKKEYFTGNTKPPHKTRPAECPLLEIQKTDKDHG